MTATAILDIDGTLVDTNYQHTLAWARGFLEQLAEAGWLIVLASSAKEAEVEHYVDLHDARELAHAWTCSADVEQTKPEPDLVLAALERGGNGRAVMLGDTPWDCRAAEGAGVGTVAVLTGGFSEAELRDSGALAVYASLSALSDDFQRSPFGDRSS